MEILTDIFRDFSVHKNEETFLFEIVANPILEDLKMWTTKFDVYASINSKILEVFFIKLIKYIV